MPGKGKALTDEEKRILGLLRVSDEHPRKIVACGCGVPIYRGKTCLYCRNSDYRELCYQLGLKWPAARDDWNIEHQTCGSTRNERILALRESASKAARRGKVRRTAMTLLKKSQEF